MAPTNDAEAELLDAFQQLNVNDADERHTRATLYSSLPAIPFDPPVPDCNIKASKPHPSSAAAINRVREVNPRLKLHQFSGSDLTDSVQRVSFLLSASKTFSRQAPGIFIAS